MVDADRKTKDVTTGTGRQVLDDIFEESRLRRANLDADVDPQTLASMDLPSDPFVGFHRGRIRVESEEFDDGDTLVVASIAQQRRYLLKRWNGGKQFKAYQISPLEGEKLRLLNVYRVMLGHPVNPDS